MKNLPHKTRIYETKLRSLLKSLTGRIIEVTLDTLLLETIFRSLGMSNTLPISFTFAVLTESLCFTVNYFNERLWNLTDWGREIRDKVLKRKKENEAFK